MPTLLECNQLCVHSVNSNVYDTQDGKYVVTALSVDYPQCPPVEGVPRAQVCMYDVY